MKGGELAYVFNYPALFDITFTPEQDAVSKQMIHYFAQFHRTGNPNNGNNEDIHPSSHVEKMAVTVEEYKWPTYDITTEVSIVLDQNYGTVSHWALDYCKKWIPLLAQQ